MNADLLPYVYDFLRVFTARTKVRVRRVLLFGSSLGPDFNSESDIDLFIDVEKKDVPIAQEDCDSSLKEFEMKAEKTWALQGMSFPIKAIIGDLDSGEWDNLKGEIEGSAKVLLSDYNDIREGARHYVLVSYDMSALHPKDKVKFLRQLYGYSTKKGGKEYAEKGLLNDASGEKISQGTILVPASSSSKIHEFFRSRKIKATMRDVMIPSP